MATYLLAYDDSESAKKALYRTIGLVSPRDVIVLVWVLPTHEKFQGFGVDENLPMPEIVERLNAAVAFARREGRQAMALTLEGDIAKEIVGAAEKLDASLIILGHKGVSKIGPFALGSVAERVTQLSNRRVLIVK